MKDYYKILEVAKTATQDEIKQAYRKLAKKWHPDVNPENKAEAEAMFKEVGEAYDTLCDPDKRASYDRPEQNSFGGFGDAFKNWNFNQSKTPRDIMAGLEISLEEAALGGVRHVTVEHDANCSACNGTGSSTKKTAVCDGCNGAGSVTSTRSQGHFMFSQTHVCRKCQGIGNFPEVVCETCGGSGEETRTSTIEVNIPAGIQTRDILRAEGMGRRGGDLKMFVVIKPHPRFERIGNDIYCDLEVPFITALQGGIAHVNGLDGIPVSLQIPRGCAHGAEITAKGKGIIGGDFKAKIRYNLPSLDDETVKKVVNLIST